MAEYHIYTMGDDGHVSAEVIEAESDQAALRKANQLIDGQIFEVWNDGRLIAHFDPPVH